MTFIWLLINSISQIINGINHLIDGSNRVINSILIPNQGQTIKVEELSSLESVLEIVFEN